MRWTGSSAARVAALCALAGFSLLYLPSCDKPGAAAPESPDTAPSAEVEVEVVTPRRVEFARTVTVTGTLFGDEEATIAAKVPGRIVETLADMGDVVEPGAVLARVDPTDYTLARDERRRAIAEALSRLGLEELPGAGFEVDGLPAVERAQLQAKNARSRFERGRSLAERTPPLISEQDFADLRTAWEVAESELRLARLEAEATLAEARTLESQLRIAEQRVVDATHRAPEAHKGPGRNAPGQAEPRRYSVWSKMVSVGDFVQMGTPMFRIVDADPVKLRAPVPERRLGQVLVGQSVEVRVEAYPEPFPGRVSRVSPAVDPATRSFTIEILIANTDLRLKPGSFATADVRTGADLALAIDLACITAFAGVDKVFVVEGGKAAERRVQLGDRADGLVEIRSGIAESDRVVLNPGSAVANGTPVRVRTAATADGGGAP